jgi:hypothetical protein
MPSFMMIRRDIQIKLLLIIASTISEASVFALLLGEVYWDSLRWHYTHKPNLMTIHSGIQAILVLMLLPQ